MRTGTVQAMFVTAAALLWLTGCPSPANHSEKKPSADGHDHDHAHNGPHHGHLMEIGEEEYHAEWTHDDTGKVTFYILDADAKKEVPISAEEITIEVKLGDNAPVTYKLPATAPQDGKTATFELVDKGLLGALETVKSPGVVATLIVEINGKKFSQRIQEHEHGH